MSKHTPGPWSYSRGNGLLVFSGRQGIADIRVWSDMADECQANACLIAAAPDLLAALQWMVDAYEFEASMNNPALLAAKAAIAKAEGRT